MLTLLISVLLSAATFLLVMSLFSAVSAIVPAIIVLVGAFFFISFRLSKKLQGEMATLQSDLMKGHIDQSLQRMEDIKKRYGKWQFFLSSTMDGQIGTIYYLKNQYGKAKPYLEKAFIRHWAAKAMLAVIYYKEKKYDLMDKVFKDATKMTKKAGLLWGVWAYCHWRLGNIDKAIQILSTGKGYLNDADPNLTQNLLSLQNSKKMRMKGYGEQWYQFQLELSPAQTMMKQGRARFQPR